MSEKELTTYLKAIKKEKSEKLLPENLKSGIELFGVTGILDSGGTVSLEEYDKNIDLCKYILGQDLPELPYTLLEYIQSDGNQYIDLNTTLNKNTKIEVKFKRISQIASSNEDAIVGSRNDTTGGYLLGFYSNGWLLYGTHQAYINKNITSNVTTLRVDKNKIYEVTDDDITLLNTYNTSTFTTPTNAVLFAERQSNNITHKSAIQLYYFKLYDNDTLIMDLIPVKRIEDNEVCLYDLVSEQFYTNKGTENFIAGGEI